MDTLGLILVVVVTVHRYRNGTAQNYFSTPSRGVVKNFAEFGLTVAIAGSTSWNGSHNVFILFYKQFYAQTIQRALNYYRVTGLLKEPLLGFIVIVG